MAYTIHSTGPTTDRTFTFPDADAILLTNHDAVTPAQGGTGIASYTVGDLLYASGAGTLEKLADVAVGSVLVSGGVGVAPAWSATPTLTSLTITGAIAFTGNTYLGPGAATSGTLNVGIGPQTLQYNTTGSNNIAIGSQALWVNPAGSNNVAIGQLALASNSGGNNVAVGSSALLANSSAAYNTAVGTNALLSNTTGAPNTAVGASAMNNTTTGRFNVALGYAALYANTTADFNTAVGYFALFSNVTGAQNVAVGGNAAAFTTGNNNVAVGYNAMAGPSDAGYANLAIGTNALMNNTSGHYNAAIGTDPMGGNTTGSYNTACGLQALGHNTTGDGNVAIGTNTAFNGGAPFVQTGSYNTYLGYAASANADGYTNATAIGNGAMITASDQIVLGNASVTSVILNGALKMTAQYVEGTEMTAPAAGAVNTGRLYFEDNGSGKTRLMVIFNTGAAQQIAIQP